MYRPGPECPVVRVHTDGRPRALVFARWMLWLCRSTVVVWTTRVRDSPRGPNSNNIWVASLTSKRHSLPGLFVLTQIPELNEQTHISLMFTRAHPFIPSDYSTAGSVQGGTASSRYSSVARVLTSPDVSCFAFRFDFLNKAKKRREVARNTESSWARYPRNSNRLPYTTNSRRWLQASVRWFFRFCCLSSDQPSISFVVITGNRIDRCPSCCFSFAASM